MDYKKKLKKYGITIEDLSVMFGAKNSVSFRHSSAYKRYLKATVSIIEKVENEIKSRIVE